MIKFMILNYEFTVKKITKKLNELGNDAKKAKSWSNIKNGLDLIKQNELKYSEYRLNKVTKVSINTIKKYRNEIEAYLK